MKASVASSAGNVEKTNMEWNEQEASRFQHISGRHTPRIFPRHHWWKKIKSNEHVRTLGVELTAKNHSNCQCCSLS